ncbi:D-alanyl-D-alanine carboxypeptidase family protein [Sphingomonas qomolangmaensis]|uniref:serine-type D-Ala-D-Ala carboxypeptidase n=1 Tax=Sphingomonas qomolangmaensis TaxID=2918765 RepID=A0ABY5LFH1_9SPHN|nr:D-alanyl-D-alanine carboxypeptidase family protein [Sphingomonas qomolangmaensis]UUL83461.1 D-alanyl-D-alanine carboxypeptidase [Sphingomonas qomolangmaensis]
MKKLLVLPPLFLALAMPASAQRPPYDTPAPVAFIEDLSSGAVLYAKDADRRMPPASMAKMMTTYVIFDMLQKGELKLDQKFRVRPETWERWHGPKAGSTMFLSPNEEVSVENLLYGVVVLSGNDACVVLAEGIAGTEEAFANLMNQRAKAIGLSNSRFGNSNGWPDEGRTYVTARDLATLAKVTIEQHPQLYKKFYTRRDFTWGQTMGGNAITQANRDPLLGRVDGADGLKTGHTEEAGYGFTGSAEQSGRRLVMVLAGLTSANQRISESVRFMEWGFGAWKSRPIVKKGKRVETADVQLGGEATVGLVAPRDLSITVPSGTSAPVTVKVVYQGPIKAPIAAGQHIADLVITSADTGEQRMPLVAEAAVEEAGFFGRVWAGLMSLFA